MGLSVYARDPWNYPQWGIYLANIVIVATGLLYVYTLKLDDFTNDAPGDESEAFFGSMSYGPYEILSNAIIVSLIMNLAELSNQLKVFDFFASFVRAIFAITNGSVEIGAFFVGVVVFQMVTLLILDASSSGQFVYTGPEGAGLMTAFIDSYRMALGDFEVIGRFEGNDSLFMFWWIFLIGTLISMLILLNMVVAIMGTLFTDTEDSKEAFLMKEKLGVILDNWFRIPENIKKKLKETHYLVCIEFDPVTEFHYEEQSEDRIIQAIKATEGRIRALQYQTARANHNVGELFEMEKSKEEELSRMMADNTNSVKRYIKAALEGQDPGADEPAAVGEGEEEGEEEPLFERSASQAMISLHKNTSVI